MGVNIDLNSVYVQKTPNVSKLDDHIKRLEEEMRKIDGLKGELPLSMLLLKNAITKLNKQAAMQCTEVQEEEEIEEVMAFKGNKDEVSGVKRGYDLSDKREWMSSVQLWSSDINFDNKKQDTVSEPKLRRGKGDPSVTVNPIQQRNGGGAFVPLKEQFGFPRTEGKEVSQVPSFPPSTPATNLVLRSNGRQLRLHCRPQNQLQRRRRPSRKKQRRNWSAELHKLFLKALDKLGGSRVATPKLIKQVMNVDDLTCDEIKSHLQKYRIHLQSPANNLSGADNCPWMANDQPGDSSILSLLQSDSSQSRSHVPIGSANGISMSGGNCMVAEEDARSDGHSWNGKVYVPREVDAQSNTYPMKFVHKNLHGNQLINIKI